MYVQEQCKTVMDAEPTLMGNNQSQKLIVWKPRHWVNEHFDEESQVSLEMDY